MALVGPSLAIDPHGAHADDLVDACHASLGFLQDAAREGRVVDDVQHDCRFTLACCVDDRVRRLRLAARAVPAMPIATSTVSVHLLISSSFGALQVGARLDETRKGRTNCVIGEARVGTRIDGPRPRAYN